MKLYTSIAAAFCTATCALAQAQTIKTDTLADLRAEYLHHRKQALPYVEAFQESHKKRMACVERIMQAPLTTDCSSEVREVQLIGSIMRGPLAKAEAAQEVYERELRKAERINADKTAKPP